MIRARSPYFFTLVFPFVFVNSPVCGEDGPLPAKNVGTQPAISAALKFLDNLRGGGDSSSVMLREGDNLARKGDYKSAIDRTLWT